MESLTSGRNSVIIKISIAHPVLCFYIIIIMKNLARFHSIYEYILHRTLCECADIILVSVSEGQVAARVLGLGSDRRRLN